jgi:hypothetical protein
VIERLIDDWLDRATERTFQKPFCHMLAAEGYTVLHMSRHCGLEAGKDILALSPDGTPCAYQLKTAKNGKISLTQWRKEISQQAFDLVTGDIVFPSIRTTRPHRSYLVTNGELEEEVIHAIDDMNRTFAKRGQGHLRLTPIVRGDLHKKAVDLHTDLWPVELENVKTLLELYLQNGRGMLPKARLASLLEAALPFGLEPKGRVPSTSKCQRAIASAAVLCSIAISSFSREGNHVAEIEAWTIHLACLCALAEKWKLPIRVWKNESRIAEDAIYNSLAALQEELIERKEFVEGDGMTDSPFYRARMTLLVALMSIFALWRHQDGRQSDKEDDFVRRFCLENRAKLHLWGEAAIPQFLAFVWYFRRIDSTPAPDLLLGSMVSAICRLNEPRIGTSLSNPYYEAIDILPHQLGIADEPLEDCFNGESYALEGLFHLFVRRNWKQSAKLLWPGITKIGFCEFRPAKKWHYFRWRNEGEGTNRMVMPKHTASWDEVRAASLECQGRCIPDAIKRNPVLLLLFVCVCPHRMNSQILRWLDTRLMG